MNIDIDHGYYVIKTRHCSFPAGLLLTDAQIEQMLAGRPCSLTDEVRSIVNKQGRLYTERLFSAVMEAGFDLHAMPLVMLGVGPAS